MQRRYEALHAYFVEDMPAAEIADRYGYSTASVHQMATLLRTGRLALVTEAKPRPAAVECEDAERRIRRADDDATSAA